MTWLKDAQGALEVQLQLFQFFPAARLQQANKMNKTSWRVAQLKIVSQIMSGSSNTP